MTTLGDNPTQATAPRATKPSKDRPQPARRSNRRAEQPDDGKNVSHGERMASVAAGGVLTLLGITRGSIPGLMVAAVGGALIHRGATGSCAMYRAMGIDTAHQPDDQQALAEELSQRGIRVEEAMLINKSPEELYRYWRDFANLPRIMPYLDRVDVKDDRHSHWVAQAPAIAGGHVEWDAEITRDEPNQAIAWRSLAGADVDNSGEVRFAEAMGDRGTEVHVTISYMPPAGKFGNWVATLFGKSPETQIREGLRSFKRTMECGEAVTTTGQPRGTCTGRGKRETEWT